VELTSRPSSDGCTNVWSVPSFASVASVNVLALSVSRATYRLSGGATPSRASAAPRFGSWRPISRDKWASGSFAGDPFRAADSRNGPRVAIGQSGARSAMVASKQSGRRTRGDRRYRTQEIPGITEAPREVVGVVDDVRQSPAGWGTAHDLRSTGAGLGRHGPLDADDFLGRAAPIGGGTRAGGAFRDRRSQSEPTRRVLSPNDRGSWLRGSRGAVRSRAVVSCRRRSRFGSAG